MKKTLIIVCCFMALFLTSCFNREIPEGDIKNFVEKFAYDLAFEHVKSGKSIIKAAYYVNDQLDGEVCSTTTIVKNETTKYYHINTDAKGSYYGDGSGKYSYHNQQILAYLKDKDLVSAYKKTDEELEQINYRLEDLNVSINNFFYLELESGYHRGGVYYGDYILANCAKYYSCFSLNSDKTLLEYKVNTSVKNSEGDEIVTMHNFIVDEYGMVVSLKSKSIVVEKNIVIETTIDCEYNNEVTQLTEL